MSWPRSCCLRCSAACLERVVATIGKLHSIANCNDAETLANDADLPDFDVMQEDGIGAPGNDEGELLRGTSK